MKKLLVLALFAVASLSATVAEATPQHRLGVDGAFTLTHFSSGGSSENYFGIGGLFRYEYTGISPQLSITGRVGYIFGLEKNSVSVSYLPFLAGVKWYFTGYTSGKREGFYAGGELGMFYVKTKVSVMGFSASNSEAKLGFTAGVGYEISNFDLGARFLAPSVGDIGDMLGLLVTVGYSFYTF